MPEQVALAHYRGRRLLVEAVADVARRLWRQVDPGRLDASWASLSAQLLVGLAGAQQSAATPADGYLDTVLSAQDLDPTPAARLVPSALAGVASDGRPLETLLHHPVVVTKLAIGSGATTTRALAAGYTNLDMIVRTQVADAGRVADQVALSARRRVGGYTRMVVGATCARCVILAGRWYRWNAGFARHP